MRLPENSGHILRIARHEAAHYVAAAAMGFKGNGISIRYQGKDAYHGQARHDLSERCETIEDIHRFSMRRCIVTIAGSIGESITNDGNIDVKDAYRIFDTSGTGAEGDRSMAHEYINILHNIEPPGTTTLVDIKNRVWKLSVSVVSMHLSTIEKVAKALMSVATIGEYGTHLDLTSSQIRNMLGSDIPRIDHQLEEMLQQIQGLFINLA